MADIPPQTKRPFEADYPAGAPTDETGRLLRDIEGRPLLANEIAGRRMVQGDDAPLPRERTEGLAKALTGRDVGRLTGGTDAGITYLPGPGSEGLEIAIRASLPAAEADRVLRHEIGHVIDELSGKIASSGLTKELTRIYDASLSGRVRERGLTGPRQVGYGPEAAPRELWAEAIRAYLTNPNSLKILAPNVASRIRATVNPNSKLNKIIQFNALPLAIGAGAGAGLLASDARASEANRELADAQESVRALAEEKQRFDGLTVAEKQEFLRSRGLYSGRIDGEWGGLTQRATESYVQSRDADLAAAQERVARLETDAAARAARPDPVTEQVRNWAPFVAFSTGAFGGHALRSLAVGDALKRLTASNEAIDARIPVGPAPEGATLRTIRERQARAAALNALWVEGGAGARVPFRVAKTEHGFSSASNAVPASQLFAPSRAVYGPDSLHVRPNDVAVAGTGLAEGAFAAAQVERLEDELVEAEAEAEANKSSQAAQQRVEDLRTQLAMARVAAGLGGGVALGRGVGVLAHRYPHARPNVPAMEAQRMALIRAAPRKPARRGDTAFARPDVDTGGDPGIQPPLRLFHGTPVRGKDRFFPWSHHGTERAALDRLRETGRPGIFRRRGEVLPVDVAAGKIIELPDDADTVRAALSSPTATIMTLRSLGHFSDTDWAHIIEPIEVARAQRKPGEGLTYNGYSLSDEVERRAADVLKRNGVTAIRYRNAREDPGSYSYVVPSPDSVRVRPGGQKKKK
jgi:hypothetical protein